MASATKKAVKQNKILDVLDYNQNGKVDIEDIIILGLKVPGVKISREEFLRKELTNICEKDTLEKAIVTTPKFAGIEEKVIEKLADEVVKYERNCVSGISTLLGLPGGYAMIATVPTDIIQYYGFLLRAAQKLLYLYGFQQIIVTEDDSGLDTTMINAITVCLGVMYGVDGANKALIAISKALAKGVEKKLLQAALTKGTIYPIVKKVSTWFGIKMTKTLFAGMVKKAIPLIGAGIGFAATFFTFKPCCEKLRKTLRESYLYKTNRKPSDDEVVIETEIVDVSDSKK